MELVRRLCRPRRSPFGSRMPPPSSPPTSPLQTPPTHRSGEIQDPLTDLLFPSHSNSEYFQCYCAFILYICCQCIIIMTIHWMGCLKADINNICILTLAVLSAGSQVYRKAVIQCQHEPLICASAVAGCSS